jgi:hypothetical protein
MKRYCVLVMVMVFTFGLSVMAQNPRPHPTFRGDRKELKRGERPMFNPEWRAERTAFIMESKIINALLEKNEAKMFAELDQIN